MLCIRYSCTAVLVYNVYRSYQTCSYSSTRTIFFCFVLFCHPLGLAVNRPVFSRDIRHRFNDGESKKKGWLDLSRGVADAPMFSLVAEASDKFYGYTAVSGKVRGESLARYRF